MGPAQRGAPEGGLLEPAARSRWQAIEEAARAEERELALALSGAERLALGERLAQEAVALYAAAVRDGHLPGRSHR